MSTKMLLTAKLDQRITMNPQLRQAITLLQYNTLDLKQLVRQCIETNPFIEVEETESDAIRKEYDEVISYNPRYHSKQSRFNQNNDDKNYIENYSIPKSLREHLLDQTLSCRLNETEQVIAEAIIDAIDENGALSLSLPDIQHIIQHQHPVSLEQLRTVLTIIQTFDPIGIAHQDLRECLLIQLNALPTQDDVWHCAHNILYYHFEKLGENNLKKISASIKISPQKLNEALKLIRSFNPKPGLLYSSEIELDIEPDLYVKKIKNNWHVFLSENLLTSLKIHSQYQDVVKLNKKHASYEGLSKELQEAQWLMKGLKRRNETLLNVATYIVERQKDFLDYGHAFMKPMNIIDVSRTLNLHESTVSRVTTEKYIATPRGMLELKYFFPSYVLTDSGDTCSATTVKEFIKDIISQEKKDRIYSDGDIATLLKQKGIHIARRTVAKYREALKILPSYQRAQIQHRS